jgi:hypothetical protein
VLARAAVAQPVRMCARVRAQCWPLDRPRKHILRCLLGPRSPNPSACALQFEHSAGRWIARRGGYVTAWRLTRQLDISMQVWASALPADVMMFRSILWQLLLLQRKRLAATAQHVPRRLGTLLLA